MLKIWAGRQLTKETYRDFPPRAPIPISAIQRQCWVSLSWVLDQFQWFLTSGAEFARETMAKQSCAHFQIRYCSLEPKQIVGCGQIIWIVGLSGAIIYIDGAIIKWLRGKLKLSWGSGASPLVTHGLRCARNQYYDLIWFVSCLWFDLVCIRTMICFAMICFVSARPMICLLWFDFLCFSQDYDLLAHLSCNRENFSDQIDVINQWVGSVLSSQCGQIITKLNANLVETNIAWLIFLATEYRCWWNRQMAIVGNTQHSPVLAILNTQYLPVLGIDWILVADGVRQCSIVGEMVTKPF